MKKLSSFLFFLIPATLCGLFAQTLPASRSPLLTSVRTDTTLFPRYRFTTIGIGSATLRDPLLSPLRYQGTAVNLEISHHKYRPRFLTQGSFSYNQTTYLNDFTKSNLLEIGLSYKYAMLKQTNFAWLNSKLWLGGYGETIINLRVAGGNVNNVLAYDGLLSFGVTGLVTKQFNFLNRVFVLTNQSSLPLYSFVVRPPYAWSFIYKDSFTPTNGFWNVYFNFQNRFMLDFYGNVYHKRKKIGKDAWRVTLFYSYTKIPQLNNVVSSSSLIMFGRIVKF